MDFHDAFKALSYSKRSRSHYNNFLKKLNTLKNRYQEDIRLYDTNLDNGLKNDFSWKNSLTGDLLDLIKTNKQHNPFERWREVNQFKEAEIGLNNENKITQEWTIHFDELSSFEEKKNLLEDPLQPDDKKYFFIQKIFASLENDFNLDTFLYIYKNYSNELIDNYQFITSLRKIINGAKTNDILNTFIDLWKKESQKTLHLFTNHDLWKNVFDLGPLLSINFISKLSTLK